MILSIASSTVTTCQVNFWPLPIQAVMLPVCAKVMSWTVQMWHNLYIHRYNTCHIRICCFNYCLSHAYAHCTRLTSTRCTIHNVTLCLIKAPHSYLLIHKYLLSFNISYIRTLVGLRWTHTSTLSTYSLKHRQVKLKIPRAARWKNTRLTATERQHSMA